MLPRPTLKRLALVLMALVLPLTASAASRSTTVSTDALGTVPLLAPAAEPDLFVILISGADGPDATLQADADADALVARGAAVALVDLRNLLGRLTGTDEACHYVFGAFEDLSHVAERALDMSTWRWPVLLGRGDGGTLAYLALAQAPSNTAAGAVSIGFRPTLATGAPLCPGAAPADPPQPGATTYEPASKLPGRWTLVLPATPTPDLAAFVATSRGRTVLAPGGAAPERTAAVEAVLATGDGPADPLSDLPLVELPADNPQAFAVILSGDGGWRDIDKQIGEYFAAHHLSVVGLDSLRYFWREKEPAQLAQDLDRILAHYRKTWQLADAALVGYSLGADALPPAWPHLAPASQDTVVLLALLGLAPNADLEVTVAGWLGLSSADSLDLAPYLAELPKDRVVCVYGKKEAEAGETGCTLPALAGATVLERDGGHHFDGNYQAIAEVLLKRIAAAAPPAAR